VTVAKPAQEWDSASVRATFAGVQVREVDPSNADVVFYYELENRTDRDYQIQTGPSVRLMSRLKTDGSLAADGRAHLADSAFVPVANRTRIAIEIPRAFAWGGQNDGASDEKLRALVQQETADIQGFVLFDSASRYQIELTGGWH
jgi:hypothetical protein